MVPKLAFTGFTDFPILTRLFLEGNTGWQPSSPRNCVLVVWRLLQIGLTSEQLQGATRMQQRGAPNPNTPSPTFQRTVAEVLH